MGNASTKDGKPRMAMGAMANATRFEGEELVLLQKKFFDLSSREDGQMSTITRAEFREALEAVEVVEDDVQIFDKLFTMYDKTGNDRIFYWQILVGLAPLCHGSVEEKLALAFKLYDVAGTGEATAGDAEIILAAINETASYFGDPMVRREDVKRMAQEVFASAGASCRYAERMSALAHHPICNQFIAGHGTVRYAP
ncbi:unnamed protein product [Phaeothamnion confervicola]